jgi:hypothetical protein
LLIASQINSLWPPSIEVASYNFEGIQDMDIATIMEQADLTALGEQ